jgi:hypothetical protein
MNSLTSRLPVISEAAPITAFVTPPLSLKVMLESWHRIVAMPLISLALEANSTPDVVTVSRALSRLSLMPRLVVLQRMVSTPLILLVSEVNSNPDSEIAPIDCPALLLKLTVLATVALKFVTFVNSLAFYRVIKG